MDKLRTLKPNTFRFLVFYGNVIICERLWEIKPTLDMNDETLTDVTKLIDTHLNSEFMSSNVAYKVTVRYETSYMVADKEIEIRNRHPKLLYRLDVKPIIRDICIKLGLAKPKKQ
jgi:hypothetical protein